MDESGSLSYDKLVVACRNIGYDLTCGKCAGVFFTGASMVGEEHDVSCSTKHPVAVKQLPSDYEACGECGFDHQYEYESAARVHAGGL